jgi:hypothetical protein
MANSRMYLRQFLLAQDGFDHEVFIPMSPETILARLSRPEDWIRLQPSSSRSTRSRMPWECSASPTDSGSEAALFISGTGPR